MMAATGASSPLIKDEPEDQFFLPHHSQRSMAGSYQSFSPSQAGFHQFTTNGESIDPNRLTMNGSGVAIPHGNNFGTTFSQSTYNGASGQTPNPHGPYSKGLETFDDDDLGLGQHDTQFQYDMQQNMYNGTPSLSIDQNAMNGYSHTPDGEPLASPYSVNFNYAHLRNLQNQSNALHSPAAFSSSSNNGSDMMHNGMTQRRPGITLMQRKHSSSNSMRSPMTPKTPVISSLKIGSAEHASFPTQPIRTAHSHRHQKTLSGQWDQTPSSLTSFPGSEYSSPIQGIHPNPQISDILKGASMPAKLNNGNAPALQSQEMKRRRRRESHNLVERRRRDNINERIQELSHLVPLHRLEDEKVRKALQNNSPLSPTLAGLSQPPNGMSPPQATSGLAGPGARRATAGNITTGIPIEEKDKGPNKGDILNGAVSWTRDLMWMLHLKMQQQEDLANIIADLGGTFPFEETEDERRMHTELMDAMQKNDGAKFHYSRAPGSGLRVPKHTDVKGDTIGASNTDQLNISLSPDNHSTGDVGQAGMGGPGQYWSGHNSGGSGAGSISFKEEDEYGMDLTQ